MLACVFAAAAAVIGAAVIGAAAVVLLGLVGVVPTWRLGGHGSEGGTHGDNEWGRMAMPLTASTRSDLCSKV